MIREMLCCPKTWFLCRKTSGTRRRFAFIYLSNRSRTKSNTRNKAERCFKAPYYLADVDVGLHNVEIMEGELADKTPSCVIQVAYKDGNSKLFVNAETGVDAEDG